MTKAERFERARRRMLLGFAVGFGTWMVARLVRELLPALDTGPVVAFAVLVGGIAGWLVFAVYLVWILRFTVTVHRDPAVEEILNDELVVENRRKALAFGFGAAMATQAALILFDWLRPASATLGANLTMLVGALSAVGTFLVLDRG